MKKIFTLKYNQKLNRYELYEGKNLAETSNNKNALYSFAYANGYKVKELLKIYNP